MVVFIIITLLIVIIFVISGLFYSDREVISLSSLGETDLKASSYA